MRDSTEQYERSAYDWPALSIKQPWAQLILEGAKDVEVRSWTTRYRGFLWIHTGRKVDEYATTRFGRTGLFTGGVVGYAYLYGIRPFSASSWEAWRERHRDDADFSEGLGKYGWILRGAKPLVPPIEAKGKTGLFHLHESVLAKLGQYLNLLKALGTG